MGELQPGEEVATADGGRSRLVAKERRGAGPEYVYNLEVWRDHNFHVGAQGVLVHNTYWDKIVQYGNGSGARFQKAIDHLWENHNPFSKVKGKSYFRNDLDTKEKIKKYVTDAQKNREPLRFSAERMKNYENCVVYDMGEIVGMNRLHTAKTKILTITWKLVDDKLVISNAFPGYPWD